jgi:hypothetical protein
MTFARGVTMSRTWTISGLPQPEWMNQTQRMGDQRDIISPTLSRSAGSVIATESPTSPVAGQTPMHPADPPATAISTDLADESPCDSPTRSTSYETRPSISRTPTITRNLDSILEKRSVAFAPDAAIGTSTPMNAGGEGGTGSGMGTGSSSNPISRSASRIAPGSASPGAQ